MSQPDALCCIRFEQVEMVAGRMVCFDQVSWELGKRVNYSVEERVLRERDPVGTP